MSHDDTLPTMGHQYAELQKARKLGTHFLGPDGKIIYPSHYDTWASGDSNNKRNLFSHDSEGDDVLEKNKINSLKESSRCSPNAAQTHYICPRCSKEFSSVSNTYRHLVNGIIIFISKSISETVLTYMSQKLHIKKC